MENVNFQPSGEEIERALMDLGPLLGVTIKEEVPDELPDANAQPPSQLNVANITDGAANVAGPSNPESGETGEQNDKGSADSLASPTAGRVQLSSARCVMCQTTLALTDGTPKLMECLHSACEPCVKAKIEERAASRDFLGTERITITCPICRLQCQPANMIDQRFVIEKIALEQVGPNGTTSGEQQCNSCEDTEPATSYCVDCAEFICDNCVHAHQRLKITKDHTIKSKEEAMAELQAAQSNASSAHDMFCREHVQERLSLFCETCDRLTCRDCQLQHHRDHKYQFSTEMAAQARSNIASLLSEVSYKRVLLGSAMKVIRDRQQLIADKKKALVHEITQTVVKLTNAINTRGKQLVLRLNEVCDAKQRTLTEKKEALEQLAAITDHCVEFVNAALEQGSDTAVLYTKHSVCAHLQRIKSRRADIPNPEIPVRINLALDKLPDLIKVLSSIGAIVVDGKVDGGCAIGAASGAGTSANNSGTVAPVAAGAGGAQGPYHQPAAPPAHPANNNSAVVALQHVAMHQPFGASGGAYLGVAALRARAHTPLRHPHVTSTTHPHHLHGMNEMNLRGLLNAASARGASPARAQHVAHAQHAQHPQHPQHPQHSAQAAMHHAYQQMMGAYASNAYAGGGGGGAPCGGRRSGGPRTPSPAPAPAAQHPPQYQHHHQPAAKWHIPQHSLANGGFEQNMINTSQNSGGSDFKITLGRPQSAQAPAATGAAGMGAGASAPGPQPRQTHSGPSVVTSTNPKTPSPSLNGGASSELDKVCAESVQDLMATIAKLDSNGVQVVAEQGSLAHGHAHAHSAAPSPAPHVHSSTDADAGAAKPAAADPNEDWCAVCMDGGELMCCDKCPKVFHQYCHIPTIEKLPDETETWQCLLCVNFAELPLSPGDEEAPAGGGLPPRAQKLVERVTLEMYCQYELSLPFREPVPAENVHYHSKISRPMCLDMIRMKLQPGSAARYSHVAQFVADCRLLFRNAYRYNPPDSQFYKDAKRLEEFFDAQLVKWLPEYAYWSGEGEPPTKRARVE